MQVNSYLFLFTQNNLAVWVGKLWWFLFSLLNINRHYSHITIWIANWVPSCSAQWPGGGQCWDLQVLKGASPLGCLRMVPVSTSSKFPDFFRRYWLSKVLLCLLLKHSSHIKWAFLVLAKDGRFRSRGSITFEGWSDFAWYRRSESDRGRGREGWWLQTISGGCWRCRWPNWQKLWWFERLFI